MRPDPLILGFDTSAAHCAAALLLRDGTVQTAFESMKKGQAERLVPLLNDLLTTAGYTWADLDALAVGIGPGNFTGIRISISTVRGMALALGCPIISVSSFDLMRGADAGTDPQLISLPTSREMNFVQLFEGGMPSGDPHLIDLATGTLPALTLPPRTTILGSRAAKIAAVLPGTPPATEAEITDVPRTLMQIAADKWHAGQVDDSRPQPLYVRPADAAPPRDPAPIILP